MSGSTGLQIDAEAAPEVVPEGEGGSGEVEKAPASAPKRRGGIAGVVPRLRKVIRRVPWLGIFTVLVPTIVAILYFGFYASDVFISESHFVVRSAQRPQANGLTALLTTGTLARSTDDTYTIHDFMRSRDAMKRVDGKHPLREMFGASRIDRFARFDGFGLDASEEALFKYYQKVVVIDFDTTTGVSVLRVHAFAAWDSRAVNELLLQMSEQLVNQLNERARKDMIDFAQSEVAAAEVKAKAAALALSTYRSQNAVFDPDRQSNLQLQAMSKLQDELIATTIQITQLKTLTPDNPQLPPLEKRLKSIEEAMREEMGKVTGGKSSLSGKAAEFERLAMDRTFAEKQLASALAGLEQARSDAQHKQLYLERIAQPSLPDSALEPRRLRSVFACLIVGLLAWGILSMLIAGIREHRD